MSITFALILFFVFVLIYIAIIETFTVLFRLTGLTHDKAQFQVISMLTSCGFTTLDSEAITSSKIRRDLAKLTIIFGYLFTVIIMSCVINIFLSLNNTDVKNIWSSIVVIIVAFAVYFILRRFKGVKGFFDKYIEKVGNKIMFGSGSNPIILLDNYGENVMAEISLDKMPAELDNVPLENSGLKENHKIQIILIKRAGETLSILNGKETLKRNDIIVVFGQYKNIRELFEKPVEKAEVNSI